MVCGSSSPNMPITRNRKATVLDHTYEVVDYVSPHMYFENEKDDIAYLAQSVQLDNHITTVASIIKFIKSKKRSDHDVYISFDEWNVWYHSREQDRKTLEGNAGWLHARCILNTFSCATPMSKVGCLPSSSTSSPYRDGGRRPAWRQTTYWPYYFARNTAAALLRARGSTARPTIPRPSQGGQFPKVTAVNDVPWSDAAAVLGDDGVLDAVPRQPALDRAARSRRGAAGLRAWRKW
ncbi:MAG: hypothetical protein R3D59_10415 [Paracoccaceae bacterium]